MAQKKPVHYLPSISKGRDFCKAPFRKVRKFSMCLSEGFMRFVVFRRDASRV